VVGFEVPSGPILKTPLAIMIIVTLGSSTMLDTEYKDMEDLIPVLWGLSIQREDSACARRLTGKSGLNK
jgi:hypothetical protein